MAQMKAGIPLGLLLGGLLTIQNGIAAPMEPVIKGNSMRSAPAPDPICTPMNCSAAAIQVTCVTNGCSSAPLPPAPCDAGSCLSEKAAPAPKG